jgi:hypothetical protein
MVDSSIYEMALEMLDITVEGLFSKKPKRVDNVAVKEVTKLLLGILNKTKGLYKTCSIVGEVNEQSIRDFYSTKDHLKINFTKEHISFDQIEKLLKTNKYVEHTSKRSDSSGVLQQFFRKTASDESYIYLGIVYNHGGVDKDIVLQFTIIEGDYRKLPDSFQ